MHTIRLQMPFRLGTVNCYLLEAEEGYILIDTGCPTELQPLERAIEDSGCAVGDLKLIVITHGDYDHMGNAAHLRKIHGAKIAMHPDDWGMAEKGDMTHNRSSGNWIVRLISPKLFGFGENRRFSPDIGLEDGDSLLEYGLNGRVIGLPGHSKGSIGVLLASGMLFCGDLLESRGQPSLNSLMDETAAGAASLERLRGMNVSTVYPGHGESFQLSEVRDCPE